MRFKHLLALGIVILALNLSDRVIRAESVVLGYSGTGVSGTLRRVIERERLWQKRGLDVKAIYFNSSTTASQAMIAGDIVVSDSDVPALLSLKVAGSLREYPVPEPKGVQAALDSIATAKDRNPQAKDFIDTSLIEEIKKSGYVERLYGR